MIYLGVADRNHPAAVPTLIAPEEGVANRPMAF